MHAAAPGPGARTAVVVKAARTLFGSKPISRMLASIIWMSQMRLMKSCGKRRRTAQGQGHSSG